MGWSGDSLGFAEVVESNLMSKANLKESMNGNYLLKTLLHKNVMVSQSQLLCEIVIVHTQGAVSVFPLTP